jgi:hypothetical protein
MDDLETSYEAKREQYNALIAENDPSTLSAIQTLNGEMAAIIHSMLEQLAMVKSNAASMTKYRDELLIELVGIQNDASIMREQRDQYVTLRMLRSQDQAVFNSSFFWYALSLGIVALLFVIVLMWKGGYKAPTMPTMMSSPNTIDALT